MKCASRIARKVTECFPCISSIFIGIGHGSESLSALCSVSTLSFDASDAATVYICFIDRVLWAVSEKGEST